ncbi:MAG: hypothetical protein D6814_16615 [Calditrichaeota bacterium]|nr:MAG: hypothetical protein D6814_16615 [Calditrichota bacterium]
MLDLEAADIAYALIRDDVTRNEPIKDLDLLIDRRKFHEFKTLAERQGFFLIKDGYLNPGKKVLVKIEGERAYLIDLHLKMVYRGMEFMSADRCLSRRVKENGFYRLSDEDYLASLLFHNVLAKKKIQAKHLEPLRRLLGQNLDEAYLKSHLARFGLAHIFTDLCRHFETYAGNETKVQKIHRKAVKQVLRAQPKNRLVRLLIRLRRIKIKFMGKPRGVLIAFIGPDGAGKSSTIRAVQHYLHRVGFNTRTAYMGPWGGSIFNFKERLKWLNLDPYREDYKAYYAGRLKQKPGPLKGRKKLKLQVRSALYYFLLMIEMYARWWTRVLPHLREGRVVLADRYIYDMLVGYKSRPMDYQEGIRTALCNAFPRPDIGILLSASPEVIFARKPQLNRRHLQLIYPVYQQVASRYGFLTLETDQSLEATVRAFSRQVIPQIQDTLKERLDR